MQMKPISYRDQRVLTSQQLADSYETTTQKIRQNFNNNKEKYFKGKHYFRLEGKELDAFKNSVENFDIVDKRTPLIVLWTEKGTLLHAKSLNTNKAWEVYGSHLR